MTGSVEDVGYCQQLSTQFRGITQTSVPPGSAVVFRSLQLAQNLRLTSSLSGRQITAFSASFDDC